jgi:xanthosine utilization system XapX-like protein
MAPAGSSGNLPYFVTEAADPEKAQMAAMLEGAFNHYAGMLVGEHLANICWGVLAGLDLRIVFLNATNVSRFPGVVRPRALAASVPAGR